MSPNRRLQIGDVTLDANSDQAATLIVSGGITLRGGNWLSLDNAYSVHSRMRFDSTAVSSEIATKLDSYYGFDFQTRTSNSKMVIRGDNGNVGIGITNPSERLEVSGSIRLTTGDNRYIQIGSLSNYFYRLKATGDDFQIVEGNDVAVRLHIDYPNGNVGIGTTSPAYKLDVNGIIGINNVPVLSSSAAYNILYHRDGGIAIYLGGSDASNYYDNGTHYFRDRSANTRMLINSTTGNVGIGTTTPSAKLHVIGDVSASILHVSGTLGQAVTQTSSSVGVGDYIYDTGITITSLVPDGPSIYELIAQYNPNTAGSVVYRNILHGHIYIEDGFDGVQNVVTVEYNELFRAIGSSSYDGSGANVNVSFVNTTNAAVSTERTTIPYASGSWQMRIRFSNNSTPPGTPSYRVVRLLRKL